MLKTKRVTSLFQIKPEMYMLVNDEYVVIENVTISNGECSVVVNGFEDVVQINDDNISTYDFATFENPCDEINAEVVYSCKVCNNPSIVFKDLSEAEKHRDRCLYNPFAQSCVLCKELKIIEYPPYPRFEKEYQSIETYHAFGAYKQPYCMKKKKNIDEFELFDDHTDCFDYSQEPVETESTPEFEKYVELIMSDDVSSKKVTVEELKQMVEEAEE